jgi:hypothetical protein
MEENEQRQVETQEALAGVDLEALIALVEARIIENLAQMIERMAGKGS